MNKDFDKWNEKKKSIENRTDSFFFNEREIWWCSVGINIAIESCGKGKDFLRPVLIFKKLSHNAFIGIPLSTQPKFGSWFIKIKILGITRYALLYQIRTFSINRFQHKLSGISKKDFCRVKQKLEKLLES